MSGLCGPWMPDPVALDEARKAEDARQLEAALWETVSASEYDRLVSGVRDLGWRVRCFDLSSAEIAAALEQLLA